MTIVPSWNFNSHPELDDSDFVTASVYALNGSPITDLANELNNMNANNWTRYQWYTNYVNYGATHNSPTDSGNMWFTTVPSWAPVAAIVVALAVFAIGMAVAVYKQAKASKLGGNGSTEF